MEDEGSACFLLPLGRSYSRGGRIYSCAREHVRVCGPATTLAGGETQHKSVPLAIARSSGRHFRPLDYLKIQFVIPPEI